MLLNVSFINQHNIVIAFFIVAILSLIGMQFIKYFKAYKLGCHGLPPVSTSKFYLIFYRLGLKNYNEYIFDNREDK